MVTSMQVSCAACAYPKSVFRMQQVASSRHETWTTVLAGAEHWHVRQSADFDDNGDHNRGKKDDSHHKTSVDTQSMSSCASISISKGN